MCSPNIGHVLLNDSPKFKYYASHAIWCIVNICTLSRLTAAQGTHTHTTAPPTQTRTSWTLVAGHIVRGHCHSEEKNQRKTKWKQNRAHERISSHSSANNKCQFSLRAAFHELLSHPSVPTSHSHTQTQHRNNGVKSDAIKENSIKFNLIPFNVKSRIRLTADRRPSHTHTQTPADTWLQLVKLKE